MRTNLVSSQPCDLTQAENRYPEKTEALSRVFNDTTNSYKIAWFLAILALIKRGRSEIFSYDEIFTEMAVSVWHPVCLFKLSLGRQDKLQNAVASLQQQSALLPTATANTIREFIANSTAARAQLTFLQRYVPTRFLMPWVTSHLKGEHTHLELERLIIKIADESQSTNFATPYYFQGKNICLNKSWYIFLTDNLGIVQSFAEHQFAHYLQARNPNVPGIINKIHPPAQRDLSSARAFWMSVREAFSNSGTISNFQDIYSERQLSEAFSIDHFLPWSFIVHDLIWNLIPVEPATNSSKRDTLPNFDLYIPRLAKLHYNAIKTANIRPRIFEEYVECFKQEPAGLLSLRESEIETKYREVILPQAQIAINLGFEAGWRY